MVRLVLTPEGALALGPGPGRGAWVCSIGCFERAAARRALDRAFRRRVVESSVGVMIDQLRRAFSELGTPGERD